MPDPHDLIVMAPQRRRKESSYTREELDAFAEALRLPEVVNRRHARVSVGEAATEKEARALARDAQRELSDQYGLSTRTSVFKRGSVYIAGLRLKPAEGGTKTVLEAPEGPNAASAWVPTSVERSEV